MVDLLKFYSAIDQATEALAVVAGMLRGGDEIPLSLVDFCDDSVRRLADCRASLAEELQGAESGARTSIFH